MTMEKYRNMEADWLCENRADVAHDMAGDDRRIFRAWFSLLETLEGSRTLKFYLDYQERLSLSPGEIWRIFHDCCDEDGQLFSITLAVLADVDPSLVHENLKLKQPVPFITKRVIMPLSGPHRSKRIRKVKNEFTKNYAAHQINIKSPASIPKGSL